MKKLLRVLSVILVVSMLFGTVTYAAEFSDVTTENKYYEPIKILSALGIINGYEDGTFGPDRDVTRAEFATMLMRAMASAGLGSSDPSGTPFKDLNDASWAISDVRTAYDLGIINGMTETTFEPNSNVTYEQALKMIVCALNYGEQANTVQATAVNVPWYYGYLQTARTLGLTDDISVLETKPAKRKEIAQMIYNALDVYVLEKVEVSGGGNMYMESTQTWMKDKLKVTRTRGEVLADESNTIDDNGAVARAGQALLTDEVNKATILVEKNGISLNGLLGKTVEYYYKTNDFGTKTLVLIYGRGSASQSVKVDAANLANITGSYSAGYTVSYYESLESPRPLTLTIGATPTISINGEVKTNVPASALNIEGGYLEFISDGANYSKINVESLETYVVKSVNRTDNFIVDMYRPSGSNTLYIDDEDSNCVINMKNVSGSSLSLNNLAQYNVLTVRKGKGVAGRTTLDVTVSTKNVSGTIKAKDTDVIDINGTKYPTSIYLNRYSGNDYKNLNVGDSCKAYLDKDGKVAYIVKSASSSTYYGYIADVGISNDVLKFALISDKTTKMGLPYVEGASKIIVDGVPYTDPALVQAELAKAAALPGTNVDGKGKPYSQLVKYTINSAGAISEIDTGIMSTEEDPTDETTFKGFTVSRKSGNVMTYKSSSYDFVGENNSKFRINSSTKVFLVPQDRYDFDSYGRKSSSMFKDSENYIVEAFDVTGSLNIAGAVVVYESAATQAKIEYNSPLFVITKISQSTRNDELCDKVDGFKITSSGSVSKETLYTEGTGVIAGKYTPGDVIMYVLDNKGNLKDTPTTLKHLLDVENFVSNKETINTGSTTNYTSIYSGLLVGAAVDNSTQMFDLAMTNNVADCATANTNSMTAGSSVKYIVYDSTKTGDDMITQHEKLDLTAFASYNDTVASGTPAATKLFVHEYNGTVRMIMVIK